MSEKASAPTPVPIELRTAVPPQEALTPPSPKSEEQTSTEQASAPVAETNWRDLRRASKELPVELRQIRQGVLSDVPESARTESVQGVVDAFLTSREASADGALSFWPSVVAEAAHTSRPRFQGENNRQYAIRILTSMRDKHISADGSVPDNIIPALAHEALTSPTAENQAMREEVLRQMEDLLIGVEKMHDAGLSTEQVAGICEAADDYQEASVELMDVQQRLAERGGRNYWGTAKKLGKMALSPTALYVKATTSLQERRGRAPSRLTTYLKEHSWARIALNTAATAVVLGYNIARVKSGTHTGGANQAMDYLHSQHGGAGGSTARHAAEQAATIQGRLTDNARGMVRAAYEQAQSTGVNNAADIAPTDTLGSWNESTGEGSVWEYYLGHQDASGNHVAGYLDQLGVDTSKLTTDQQNDIIYGVLNKKGQTWESAMLLGDNYRPGLSAKDVEGILRQNGIDPATVTVDGVLHPTVEAPATVDSVSPTGRSGAAEPKTGGSSSAQTGKGTPSASPSAVPSVSSTISNGKTSSTAGTAKFVDYAKQLPLSVAETHLLALGAGLAAGRFGGKGESAEEADDDKKDKKGADDAVDSSSRIRAAQIGEELRKRAEQLRGVSAPADDDKGGKKADAVVASSLNTNDDTVEFPAIGPAEEVAENASPITWTDGEGREVVARPARFIDHYDVYVDGTRQAKTITREEAERLAGESQ